MLSADSHQQLEELLGHRTVLILMLLASLVLHPLECHAQVLRQDLDVSIGANVRRWGLRPVGKAQTIDQIEYQAFELVAANVAGVVVPLGSTKMLGLLVGVRWSGNGAHLVQSPDEVEASTLLRLLYELADDGAFESPEGGQSASALSAAVVPKDINEDWWVGSTVEPLAFADEVDMEGIERLFVVAMAGLDPFPDLSLACLGEISQSLADRTSAETKGRFEDHAVGVSTDESVFDWPSRDQWKYDYKIALSGGLFLGGRRPSYGLVMQKEQGWPRTVTLGQHEVATAFYRVVAGSGSIGDPFLDVWAKPKSRDQPHAARWHATDWFKGRTDAAPLSVLVSFFGVAPRDSIIVEAPKKIPQKCLHHILSQAASDSLLRVPSTGDAVDIGGLALVFTDRLAIPQKEYLKQAYGDVLAPWFLVWNDLEEPDLPTEILAMPGRMAMPLSSEQLGRRNGRQRVKIRLSVVYLYEQTPGTREQLPSSSLSATELRAQVASLKFGQVVLPLGGVKAEQGSGTPYLELSQVTLGKLENTSLGSVMDAEAYKSHRYGGSGKGAYTTGVAYEKSSGAIVGTIYRKAGTEEFVLPVTLLDVGAKLRLVGPVWGTLLDSVAAGLSFRSLSGRSTPENVMLSRVGSGSTDTLLMRHVFAAPHSAPNISQLQLRGTADYRGLASIPLTRLDSAERRTAIRPLELSLKSSSIPLNLSQITRPQDPEFLAVKRGLGATDIAVDSLLVRLPSLGKRKLGTGIPALCSILPDRQGNLGLQVPTYLFRQYAFTAWLSSSILEFSNDGLAIPVKGWQQSRALKASLKRIPVHLSYATEDGDREVEKVASSHVNVQYGASQVISPEQDGSYALVAHRSVSYGLVETGLLHYELPESALGADAIGESAASGNPVAIVLRLIWKPLKLTTKVDFRGYSNQLVPLATFFSGWGGCPRTDKRIGTAGSGESVRSGVSHHPVGGAFETEWQFYSKSFGVKGELVDPLVWQITSTTGVAERKSDSRFTLSDSGSANISLARAMINGSIILQLDTDGLGGGALPDTIPFSVSPPAADRIAKLWGADSLVVQLSDLEWWPRQYVRADSGGTGEPSRVQMTVHKPLGYNITPVDQPDRLWDGEGWDMESLVGLLRKPVSKDGSGKYRFRVDLLEDVPICFVDVSEGFLDKIQIRDNIRALPGAGEHLVLCWSNGQSAGYEPESGMASRVLGDLVQMRPYVGSFVTHAEQFWQRIMAIPAMQLAHRRAVVVHMLLSKSSLSMLRLADFRDRFVRAVPKRPNWGSPLSGGNRAQSRCQVFIYSPLDESGESWWQDLTAAGVHMRYVSQSLQLARTRFGEVVP